MGIDRYSIKANAVFDTYFFVSEGPNGEILKKVQFSKTDVKKIYNLAFGDSTKDLSDLDDIIISDNQDRDKVLATVVHTIYLFTERNPTIKIFITGSTPSRTRLYRMAISKFYDELSQDFLIEGITETAIVDFEKNNHYLAFLITRRINL